jgi:hypothetical protein
MASAFSPLAPLETWKVLQSIYVGNKTRFVLSMQKATCCDVSFYIAGVLINDRRNVSWSSPVLKESFLGKY